MTRSAPVCRWRQPWMTPAESGMLAHPIAVVPSTTSSATAAISLPICPPCANCRRFRRCLIRSELQIDPGDQLRPTFGEEAKEDLEQVGLVEGMDCAAPPVALVDPDVMPLRTCLGPSERALEAGHRGAGDSTWKRVPVLIGGRDGAWSVGGSTASAARQLRDDLVAVALGFPGDRKLIKHPPIGTEPTPDAKAKLPIGSIDRLQPATKLVEFSSRDASTLGVLPPGGHAR